MDNQLNIKEKLIKKNSYFKKDPIIKKTINLTSLDKLKIYHNSNILKNNNDNKNIDNALSTKNNQIENVNIYEQKKIKQKMKGEAIHKRKIIDYIILNKKNYNSVNIKNKQTETKENNFINNIYKENYENKKKLEELINDYSLKKKMIDDTSKYNSTNNTIQDNYTNKEIKNNIIDSNYNSELNSVKKEINQESEENNNNITNDLDIANYQKKRPFYALDCKIYYKNKNIEKNTPFKNKIIKNKASFSKKINISKNNSIYSENTFGIKNRNSFRIAPINLAYKNVYNTNANNESDNNLSINNDNKLYIKIGRNKKNINNKKNDANTNENNEKEKKENILYQNFIKSENKLKKNKNDEIQTFRKIDSYPMNINLNDDIIIKNSRNTKKGINRKHRSFNKHSFNFLVNQTNRNKELSLSFTRRYKSKKQFINSNSNNDVINNDSLSYSNYYNETDNGDQESNKSSSIMYYNNNLHSDKRYHFEKDKNYRINSSHKIMNSNDNLLIKNTIFKDINSNENKRPYYNRIISDNYIEFTPTSMPNANDYTLKNNNNEDKNFIFKISHKKNGVLMPNKGKITQMKMNDPQYKFSHSKISSSHSSLGSKNNINSNKILEKEKNNSSSDASFPSAGGNFYSFINLELLYFLEEKMRNTVEKIKNYEKCSEECHQYINYYFMHNFYIEELRVFKINQNREFMINYLKMELLCYFLLYTISLGDKFKEAKILLKAIFEILYNNFLIFISLIISQNQKKESNIINVLNKIINDNIDKNNLNKILFDINNLDENKYIEIILSNSKSIDDYYKMIINNIYINNLSQENNYKFLDYININPNELDKNKIEKIIESFFVESYQSLSNFNFDIYNKFYYSFLCPIEFEDKKNKNNNSNNNDNKNDNNNSDINFNNDNILEEKNNNKMEKEKEKEKKYLLPEIKNKTYSLILDLDETIIYAQRSFNYKFRKNENNINKKRIILRPCLQEFLCDMKPLFELIVFSSGTPDYVDPIIKIIEKNEKFFDHVLYRHHISLDDEGNNVKNLDLIGRDLKKTIIIDDIPRYFHLQKRNGINIKPFCGNILSDTKTLKTLNNVLKIIRADAEETEDIRISLEKYKHLLYPNVINDIAE